MDDLDDLTARSPDQKSFNDDLTAKAAGHRQADGSSGGRTGGRSVAESVDESFYDDLVENSCANIQLDDIEDLYDVLMETPEISPELFSEPVLIGLHGKEFEATLAEPFSPFDSMVSLLSGPNCPQTKYKVNELDFIGLASIPKQLAEISGQTVNETLETIDGRSLRVEIPVGQDFDSGVFCYSTTKASRFQYFFILNHCIKSRYRTDRIGEILLESALITNMVLEKALAKQRSMRGLQIGHIIAKLAKLHPKKIEQVLHKGWRNHTGSKRIFAGDILVKSGIVTREQVEKAHEIQAKLRRKKIGDMLIESGSVSEEVFYSALAEKFRKPFVDLKTIEPYEDAKSLLPGNLALELNILPLTMAGNHLVLATSRPEMVQEMDVLRSRLDCTFDLTVATPSQLKAAIMKKYGN